RPIRQCPRTPGCPCLSPSLLMAPSVDACGSKRHATSISKVGGRHDCCIDAASISKVASTGRGGGAVIGLTKLKPAEHRQPAVKVHGVHAAHPAVTLHRWYQQACVYLVQLNGMTPVGPVVHGDDRIAIVTIRPKVDKSLIYRAGPT
ncbi:hypothetical protein EV363DRAFT_1183371, partial [Boletus edulis]